ncbi:LysE family transporter [Gloeocapsopsis crepidinum LEGE 06123]|uniref:LysE family transporter n=1 Tax=Gloeocapsopsis crepidinum LEGE 06123 TaxID=588587 RepID=A0ABR9URF3_9CHRO|nr:LysE family transporter [Gloeocapsopsis crepidinum]MBE9190847.1 LysE family transporter [Gloeocapsopsis crepidinum LEGE 06123]
MLALFFTALLLGFIFNAAPGAVFAETIRQGVRGGFKPALAVQIGSLVGDELWAVLGLAGVGLLLQLDFLRLPVGIAGILYLLWLAWDAWQEANDASIPNPKRLDAVNLSSVCDCLFSPCAFLATKPLEFIRISSRLYAASSYSQRTLIKPMLCSKRMGR